MSYRVKHFVFHGNFDLHLDRRLSCHHPDHFCVIDALAKELAELKKKLNQ